MVMTDPLQMNGYAYSHNSPVSRSDPTGLLDLVKAEAQIAKQQQKQRAQYIKEKYTKAHDTVIIMYKSWLRTLQPKGVGRLLSIFSKRSDFVTLKTTSRTFRAGRMVDGPISCTGPKIPSMCGMLSMLAVGRRSRVMRK